jgi:hypothetical protein
MAFARRNFILFALLLVCCAIAALALVVLRDGLRKKDVSENEIKVTLEGTWIHYSFPQTPKPHGKEQFGARSSFPSSPNWINAICLDGKSLWIGTHGGYGLWHRDMESGKWEKFPVAPSEKDSWG